MTMPYLDAQRITLTTTVTSFAFRNHGDGVGLVLEELILEVPDGTDVVDPHLQIEGQRVPFPLLVGLGPRFGSLDLRNVEGIKIPAGHRFAIRAALASGSPDTTGFIKASGQRF